MRLITLLVIEMSGLLVLSGLSNFSSGRMFTYIIESHFPKVLYDSLSSQVPYNWQHVENVLRGGL